MCLFESLHWYEGSWEFDTYFPSGIRGVVDGDAHLLAHMATVLNTKFAENFEDLLGSLCSIILLFCLSL
ncbi:hypothetical protein SOVF_130780 [Spinacia oleracea]|nr:hypothetical protein SOVF_130780 [Spinacia oleracea]